MDEPHDTVDRLVAATNDHDLDALAGCFAVDYVNETPLHPSRSFEGRDQVRRNWEQIFAFVPDLRAELVGRVATRNGGGEEVWTEWKMTGTRLDGTAHEMAGVIVFGIGEGVIRRARFYLEPIDTEVSTVDDAVRQQVVR